MYAYLVCLGEIKPDKSEVSLGSFLKTDKVGKSDRDWILREYPSIVISLGLGGQRVIGDYLYQTHTYSTPVHGVLLTTSSM